jgi:hypothetical protein
MQNLDDRIIFWEQQQANDLMQIKKDLNIIEQNFSSNNIIKSIISNIINSTEIKSKIIVLIAGFIIEKIFMGDKKNIIKNTISNIISKTVEFFTLQK